MFKRTITPLALAAVLFIAACESSEEKAEGFYQSGLELLAAGDPDRAAVEFRNVFRFNGEHEDARRQLAEVLLAQGKTSAAYGQYLRLAEQYPELPDVRQSLARLAIAQQSWEDAERHGRKAIELAPDAAIARSIEVSLDYRLATIDDDTAQKNALVQQAQALLDADPQDIMSRRILIANATSQSSPSTALDHIDYAIQQFPNDLSYYVIKLQVLNSLQDNGEIEQVLKQMYTQFPENEEVQQSLISFYLRREDFAGAEAFLRDLAGDDTADPTGFAPVIQLIQSAHGRDAAKAEVQRLIDANADNQENSDFYRALLAGYIFEDGDSDTAIANLQSIVADAEESDQTRRIKGTLATMLLRTGNQVGGRAIVEEILAEDAANVTALKLRAELLIGADQPSEAIIDLRRALDQSPRDTSILLLLASAHERNGSPELQGERLGVAVDVSNAGARESLLYADFLLRNDRRSAARSVLADARNANPNNLSILAQSAQLALADNAIGLVRGIIADVEKLQDQDGGPALLQSLRTALLLRQDRVDEGLSLLQQQAGNDGQNTRAVYAIMQTQLQAGKLDEARTYLNGLLENNSDDINLRMIEAALYVAEGAPEQSEAVLRDIVDKNPQSEAAVSQLYIQLRRTGQNDAAQDLLNTALETNETAPRLLLFQAGELELAGDIDGAISIYETLYARDSNNVTIANNLASLLSAYRDNPEDQARAAAVARRLRGTQSPPFQDTYGWIAYQQGEFEEALSYLEPAAEGLSDNALVQFHLGMTYLALERTDEAQTTLSRALDVAGPDSTLPQMQRAREALQNLQNN